MITAKDAIAAGRALLGTPYSELDCIGFIKKIIRTAPGGDAKYTTAGTNTLWKSYSASRKYRDLVWRQEGIAGARAGMLAFKRSGDDVHHVGIVAERPQCGEQRGGDWESQGAGKARDYASSPGGHQLTVIHSSSARGCVVETALDSSWALLAVHRYIATGDALATVETEGGETMSWKAKVVTQSGPLNMRDMPSTAAARIMQIPRGAVVDVFQEDDGWAYVFYKGETGWVSAQYLERVDEPDEAQEDDLPEAANRDTTTLMNEAGQTIVLVGSWRVIND